MKYRLTSVMKDVLMCLTELEELTNLKDIGTGTVYFVSQAFRQNNNLPSGTILFPEDFQVPDGLITASTINALRKRRLVISKSDKAMVLHTVTLSEKGQEVCNSIREVR